MKPTELPLARSRRYTRRLCVWCVLVGLGGCDSPPDAVAPDASFVPPPTAREGTPAQRTAPAQTSREPSQAAPPEREPESVLGVDPWVVPESEVSPYLNSPAHAFYLDAQDAIGRGDLEEAIRLLQNAVQIDPEHGQAWSLLWDTVRDGPDRGAAADACAGVVAHGALVGHARTELQLQCAVVHHGADRLDEAEQLARAAVEGSDGRLEPLITLTGILLVQQRPADVVQLLEGRVRRLGGRLEASALNHLAAAYYQLERLPEAIETYRQASENDPTRADILINLAGALARAQQVDEARTVLNRVLERDPGNSEARARLDALGN